MLQACTVACTDDLSDTEEKVVKRLPKSPAGIEKEAISCKNN